ncbi:MAG: hypothetical protein ACHQVS_03055 [Candidatus Babeliales bacterium]
MSIFNQKCYQELPMSYCAYYQAQVERSRSLFLVALLRSYEHVSFDRTLDVPNSIFEFYVPEDQEESFLGIMHALEQEGIIQHLNKLPNRLITEELY